MNTKKKRINVEIPESVHLDFKIKSLKEGKTITEKLKELLIRYIKHE